MDSAEEALASAARSRQAARGGHQDPPGNARKAEHEAPGGNSPETAPMSRALECQPASKIDHPRCVSKNVTERVSCLR